MTIERKFTNNARTTITTASLGPSDTTLTVNNGSVFPAITGDEFFTITLFNLDGETEGDREIVLCTARSGNILTIDRAQEGTTALTWTSGDFVELRGTAGIMDEVYDHINSAGTVYELDVPSTGDASDSEVVLGSDSRLDDSRTPVAHKSSHSTSGSDALSPSDIGAATDDHNHSGTYEPTLGNPESDGFVLISTTTGTRSWIEQSASVSSATTDAEGIVELATNEESIDPDVDDKVITPSTLNYAINNALSSYGLRWIPASDTFTRLYDAAGLTGGTDFDVLEPWASIRRCNLSDAGEVLAYHGDPTFSYTGSNGQVMVEVPKFYYRTEATSTTKTFIVSPTKNAGLKIHPAFVRDGVEVSHLYVSAFEGFYNATDGTIDSIANVVPSTSVGVSNGSLSPIAAYPDATIVGCRGYAQERGAGWEIMDFLTHNALCYLMFVEYGTFDSQTAIGRGVVDKASGSNNNANLTGHTAGYDSGTDLGNGSGYTGTNGLVSVSYRGVENMWGNIWKWIDGLNVTSNVPWIADHGFTSDKFKSPYYSLNVTLPKSNNYGGDIVVNDYFDAGFLTSALGGADNSGLYNYYYQNTGVRVALSGGSWNAASSAGALCWHLFDSSASVSRHFGARSLYIPVM